MNDANHQVLDANMQAALTLAQSSLSAGYSFAGDKGIDARALLQAYGLLVGQCMSDELGADSAARLLRVMADILERGESLVGRCDVSHGTAH